MQTVQNLKDGLWNLPSTVNNFLGREDTQSISEVKENNGNDNQDAKTESEPEDEGIANSRDSVVISKYQDEAMVHSTNSSLSYGYEVEANDQSPHTIPFALIREHWQLILDHEASIPEMENAIARCKDLVIRSAYDSEERKWLVRYLIELRHRLRELQEVDSDPDALLPETKIIQGHHFEKYKNCPPYKVHCDHCSGIIWNVLQASYVCTDCSFAVHHKCIRNIIRVCAHITTTERNTPIDCICPEIGLAFQKYTCAECGVQLSYNVSTAVSCFGFELRAEKLTANVPRLCDYSGLYYCSSCHWNDTSVIPARVMNNWDFVPRKVGRASLQQIRLLYNRPIINLEERNPRLFDLIHRLAVIKKLRGKLIQMRRYLNLCRIAEEQRLLRDTIGLRKHLMRNVDMYSLADLVGVENGCLLEFLQKTHDAFNMHIRNCLICSGKAYICEVCNNEEVIYPFDDAVVSCERCNSATHRVCHIRKNLKCMKCIRLKKREQQNRNELLDAANGN
ncbi:differentially expressed in FDCP 8 homolog [Uranotaenia lowii]|uniref:differentially expressed in FDCP 8 homolog n=1 Tax=Uranotaenia lowii TaxID=190385 RepID=UPI00247A9F89|nr:differentially expressed in FDCP 8 homolog [Uranotaenia lowii]